jgi:hypothetical protein
VREDTYDTILLFTVLSLMLGAQKTRRCLCYLAALDEGRLDRGGSFVLSGESVADSQIPAEGPTGDP